MEPRDRLVSALARATRFYADTGAQMERIQDALAAALTIAQHARNARDDAELALVEFDEQEEETTCTRQPSPGATAPESISRS